MIWAYFQGEKRFQGQLAGQRCYRTLAYVKTFLFVTNLHMGICPRQQKHRSLIFGVAVQLLIVKPNWKART